MNRIVAVIVLAVFAAVGCTTPDAMQAPGTTNAPAQAGNAQRPWERAQAVVRATNADASKGGIPAIRTHVADLEGVLANANQAFSVATASTNPAYVLTDGQTETVAALLFASAGVGGRAPGTQVVAIENPYPLASFFLGTYYNEIGRPNDALRALDAGLALPTAIPGADSGETRPMMLSERGIALASLKRWQDSLASYDRGLAIEKLDNPQRAVLLRGRGFALIELGRLDDAERAYRESLMVEPNNPRALQELTYIMRLRAGGPMAPPEISTSAPPPQPSL
jgi:tetratricopeptide (TPR) repeat protein